MLHLKSFEFNPIQENTYLIYNRFNECAIIDPGCYFDHEKDTLVRFIEDNNLQPKLLLNTHCHLDHVFGNHFIAEKYGLTLRIHENEIPVIRFAPASGLMYNLPFDNYTGAYEFIKEGEEIMLGEEKLVALLTPGHSPGSISFYHEAGNFVISGDALFFRSIGRTDLPMGDHEQLLTSIREQLLSLPDETAVYSGHGPSTNIGAERLHNPFLQ